MELLRRLHCGLIVYRRCDGRRGPRKRDVLRMLLEDYLCQIMWVHVEIRCGGGFRWEQGIPGCTQIHTSLIVNQAYACATTNSTIYAAAVGWLSRQPAENRWSVLSALTAQVVRQDA
jgi:hypothetical protein